MALFGIVRRLPRTWHVWGACVAILFQIILILISPVFIAPMFNKYTPLTDSRIRDPILRIARQNGISATTVYQVDASRQMSTHGRVLRRTVATGTSCWIWKSGVRHGPPPRGGVS